MSLLDLLFPKLCLECGKPNKYICDKCLAKVEVLNRLNRETKTISIFKYTGVIRKAIVKIKYNFAYDIASELANVCIQNLKMPYPTYKTKNYILLPIPLHKKRENWRGFNQSEILGKLIAEKMDWRFKTNSLIRPTEGQNQVGLSQIERVRN